jgi:hypothetical protein
MNYFLKYSNLIGSKKSKIYEISKTKTSKIEIIDFQENQPVMAFLK